MQFKSLVRHAKTIWLWDQSGSGLILGTSPKSADRRYKNLLMNQTGEHFASQDSNRLPPEEVTNLIIVRTRSDM